MYMHLLWFTSAFISAVSDAMHLDTREGDGEKEMAKVTDLVQRGRGSPSLHTNSKGVQEAQAPVNLRCL